MSLSRGGFRFIAVKNRMETAVLRFGRIESFGWCERKRIRLKFGTGMTELLPVISPNYYVIREKKYG